MPRYANPAYGRYPVDPAWAQLGGTLATALFGDPQARAEQERQQAEMDRIAAETAYNNERTTGLRFQNDATADLADPEKWQILTRMGMDAQPEPVTLPDGFMPGISALPPAPVAASAPQAVVPNMPSTGLPGIFLSGAPQRAAASGQPTSAAPQGQRTYRTPADVTGLIRSIVPNATITQTTRSANSELGRANPSSYHIAGRAIDMAPVPGMTFEQMRQRLAASGLNIVEALDEVTNPSAHSTGPHWHFAWGDPASSGGNRTATASPRAAGATPLAQATIPDAQYVAEPEGMPVDMERLSNLVRLMVISGEDNPARIIAAITGYSGDDRTARGALISQGNSPSADFAATRERADNIAIRDAQSELVRAISGENLEQAGDTLRNDADNTTSMTNNAADNQTSRANNAADNATSRANNAADNATSRANNADDNASRGRGGGRGGGDDRNDLSAADVEQLDEELYALYGNKAQFDALPAARRARIRQAAQDARARGETPINAARAGADAGRAAAPRTATPRAATTPTTRNRVVSTPTNVIRFDAQGNRIN